MKIAKIIVLISFLLIYNNQSFAQCAICDDIYSFKHNNKSYNIVQDKMNWSEANICAQEMGGYLVEINDSLEQMAMFNAIVDSAQISDSYASVGDGGNIAYIWIGANDLMLEGVWHWENSDSVFWNGQGDAGVGTGTPFEGSYNNWGGSADGFPHEPDNFNNQDAAGIALEGWPSFNPGLLGDAGEWNDINASNQLYFIVEFDYDNTASIDMQNACYSFSWIDGITYTESNNLATHTLSNTAGCDSVVSLNLTVDSIDVSVIEAIGYEASAIQTNASYQWLDCGDNFNPLVNETEQIISIYNQAYVAVEITKGACIDTSTCIDLVVPGIEDIQLLQNTIVFPNPSNGIVNVHFENNINSINVEIYTLNGKLCSSEIFKNSNELDLTLNGERGVYLLNLNIDGLTKTIKVLKH